MFCNNIPMQIIGHRGVMGEAPQNTLASFEMAIKAGLPAIEMDARLAITGEVIIFHEWEVSKVTVGASQGALKVYPFKKLRKLDVNDGFSGGPYQIPTLEEVLDLVDRYAKGGGGQRRDSNPQALSATDFKSAAYTNSATRPGGAYEIRTRVQGFADPCLTPRPTRQKVWRKLSGQYRVYGFQILMRQSFFNFLIMGLIFFCSFGQFKESILK
jgi:hypothetical protein